MESLFSSENMIISASVLFVTVVVAVAFAIFRATYVHNRILRKRLSSEPEGQESSHLDSARKPLESLGKHLTLPDSDELTRIRFSLSQAGYYSKGSVKVFYAVRLLSLLVPQFIILLFWEPISEITGPQWIFLVAATFALLGLLGPQTFIKKKQETRKLQMKNGFPDFMDLLVASIEAGVGLDAALVRVADEIGGRYPALKTNLDVLNMELRAGRERHTGMSNFAQRLGLDEAKALAVMLRQSEEMGSSLGKALRTFSADMRMKRMMMAEEKAMALSAKLTVPLIVFIFPAIMLMLLLPAGVRLSRAFLAVA